ncbi:hypothetical protein [Phaeocystidibacter luteus]|uniref:Uncharacterized protein n=1 Tax=Phaeocystidibacter luteus TaxID=911197 RepID=A0A6N6RJS1_9FLAO|nr:hypothetical protein [Phaeocystidibacter luteus]KAB2814023.1 hypothetical protein F8C67_04910 [Phaeocystidibacter luteus]
MSPLPKNIVAWISGLSAAVGFYMILFLLPFDWSERLALFLGLVLPIFTIRMVYLILKSDYDREDSFEDRFYEDGSLRSGRK